MSKGKAILAMAAFISALALSASLAGSARADAPIDAFSTTPLSGQAGEHGDLWVSFDLRPLDAKPEVPCLCNVARDITINTPPGLIGIPQNLPRCTAAEFATGDCPVESQIGVATVFLNSILFVQALYNMEAASNQAGLIAIEIPNGTQPIYTSFTVRTESDFGLEAKTFGIPRIVEPEKINYVFWGVPGDSSHDALRFPPPPEGFTAGSVGGEQFLCNRGDLAVEQLVAGINPVRAPDGACSEEANNPNPPSTPYNLEVRPFLVNPTSCVGPTTSTIETLAYDRETAFLSSPTRAMSGCEQLPFNPSQSAKPTTTRADSPSGMNLTIEVPQPFSSNSPSASQIRATDLLLPEGFTINAAAANGKSACTDAQARFGTRLAAQCPESAKIGTLQIESSSLPGILPGALYLGEPMPGNRYRVFLVADGFSLHIKLPGRVEPDPDTGRVRVIFEDLPQAPFERFDLRLFGGERSPLATPERCGRYAAQTTFTPWATGVPEQTATQFFTIDEGPGGAPCPGNPRDFDPDFEAGVTDNTGGAYSPFIVNLRRADGDQYLAAVDVSPPPGFSGILKGIPYCPEVAIATLSNSLYEGVEELSSPACGSESQVGTAIGGAGAGSRPLYQPGKVYLAGPYGDAPLSLVVVIPAVSGPYDLGNVVTRVKIYVDPTTGRVSTVSDPLPRIIEGIPLRVRSIRVAIDREGFALNPTNCAPLSVDSTLYGDEGAKADRSAHFQVANCGSLDFAPRLGIRLRGSGKRNAHPALQAVLRANEGDANIGRSAVTLPRTTLLDQGNIRTICTRDQFATDSCPPGSIYGRAVAASPLLDQPLRGPVYLRSNGGARTLPDLVADLHGQVDFELVGFVDSVRGGLRTIFPTVPDVPVSKFVLRLQGGGRKGLVVNSTNLCRNPARFRSVMKGQNGRRFVTRPKLRVPCGKARKRAKAKRRRAGVSLARKAG